MRGIPQIINNKQHTTMQEEKKYQLTDETRNYYGKTLYRIQAIKDFGDVKAGDKGGWVASERNLSQQGNCWIYDDSIAFGNPHVSGNTKILNDSKVCEFACVAGNAVIDRHSTISGEAFIKDAKVSNMVISNYTQILDDVEIKSQRYFYTFNLWLPYDEFVTYLPYHDKFSYCGKSYTKEELVKHADFAEENDFILGLLNKIIDLCNYYKEAYL